MSNLKYIFGPGFENDRLSRVSNFEMSLLRHRRSNQPPTQALVSVLTQVINWDNLELALKRLRDPG